MKQAISTGLVIISVTASIASLIAMLVLVLTSLNIYGSIELVPLEDLIPPAGLFLAFLLFLALMILFMILGTEDEQKIKKPLLLEEPELPSDAPVPFTQRLEYELKFCLEHKADMSLLVISCTGSSEEFKKRLRTFFDASSFIVPYDNNTLGIIIPFHDVRTAVREMTDFFDAFRFELSSSETPCFGGLTSISGRTIDGETLLYEAEVSLERARHENRSCIMCFHPDPIKYSRSYSL